MSGVSCSLLLLLLSLLLSHWRLASSCFQEVVLMGAIAYARAAL
jgi:hypothetical protein